MIHISIMNNSSDDYDDNNNTTAIDDSINRLALRPISLLTLWISEALTQA